MMVSEEINIIASSDVLNGAKNKSSDGSYFEIHLQEAIEIPKEALSVSLSMQTSTIWWNIHNVITGVNDRIYITGPNLLGVITPFVLTLPSGLYDLNGMNQAILRELENTNAKIDPAPLILLSADESTQKIQVRFNYPSVLIDFTPNDTFRDILGFNAQIVGPFIDAPFERLADNVAAFNTTNYFLVHCDLTSTGIRVNDKFTQTIAQVPIDVAPGAQITYTPFHIPVISVNELIGSKKNIIRLWLTNDKNERVNTENENWSAALVIKYQRPFLITHNDARLK